MNNDGNRLIGAVDSGRNSIAMTLLASLSSANTRCTWTNESIGPSPKTEPLTSQGSSQHWPELPISSDCSNTTSQQVPFWQTEFWTLGQHHLSSEASLTSRTKLGRADPTQQLQTGPKSYNYNYINHGCCPKLAQTAQDKVNIASTNQANKATTHCQALIKTAIEWHLQPTSPFCLLVLPLCRLTQGAKIKMVIVCHSD